MTARTREPERESQNERARTREPERKSHNERTRTREPEQENQNETQKGTARTGQLVQDSQDRKGQSEMWYLYLTHSLLETLAFPFRQVALDSGAGLLVWS
jgi:FtsZ-interacting cell division protein YlmF